MCQAKYILAAALVPFLCVGGMANAQDNKDPHRPACTTAHCLKIKSFLKTHY